MMTSSHVLPEVAERCLNHKEENKVKRIYQRHNYREEMREAWRLLGERLELLTRPDDNVILLQQRCLRFTNALFIIVYAGSKTYF